MDNRATINEIKAAIFDIIVTEGQLAQRKQSLIVELNRLIEQTGPTTEAPKQCGNDCGCEPGQCSEVNQ